MRGWRWEDMERDCLVNIFRRLSLRDLTVGVPFVCRSWFTASLDPLCWRVLNLRDLDFMPWSHFCKQFTALYAVRRLSFSGLLKVAVARSKGAATELRFPLVFGASFQDLAYASNRCPRLKIVLLPNLLSADEPRIPEIIGKWKDLERIEMEMKPSSFLEIVKQINLNCKKFSGLRMFGSIKMEDVSAIVNYLPAINHLCLSNSYLPKQQLVGILNGCRELEKLSVAHCIGFEADEEILKKASGIRTFECEGSKLYDDSGYETDERDALYF